MWQDPVSDPNDEGFGPATDLMVSLVAVLIVLMALLHIQAIEGIKDRETGPTLEQEVVAEITKDIDAPYLLEAKETFSQALNRICGLNGPLTFKTDIRCVAQGNDQFSAQDFVTKQVYSFGGGVLFTSADHELNDSGKEVLDWFRNVLAESAHHIEEIQILGHTDTVPIAGNDDNMNLGWRRARAVFDHLVQLPELDPRRMLISATSYGEFRPVDRDPKGSFSSQSLKIANVFSSQKDRNRRIEIAVIFRTVELTR